MQQDPFSALSGQDHLSLRSWRRDGRAVDTALWFVRLGDRLYMRTMTPSGKVRRIRRDGAVMIAPCTADGTPTGPFRPARARVMAPDDATVAEAEAALQARYGEARTAMTQLMQERDIPLCYIEVWPS